MSSGIEVEQTADRFVLTAETLRLELSRTTDRWQHRISARPAVSEPWHLLLSSVEGKSDEHSPPSAALQDCFLQEIATGIQELQLLGQAGKNVYSAAIRMDEGKQEIGFDFCLRTPVAAGVPEVLSTYELAPEVARSSSLTESGVGLVMLLSEGFQPEFEMVLASGSLPGQAALQFEMSHSCLQVSGSSATELGVSSGRRSLRWRYRLRLTASA